MTEGSHTARFRIFVIAMFGLALHASLAMGWWGGLPVGARLAAAFVVLVLFPGAAWLRIIGAQIPGGSWLAPGWMLPLGVGWNALLLLMTVLLGLPFTLLANASLITTALLWAVAVWRTPSVPDEPAERVGGLALVFVFLAAGLAAWHAGIIGTYITWYSDSPDHIATIRRMLETANPFPTDAFFRDAGAAGADPRKGMWHPQVALIAQLAQADPHDAWRNLSACLSPLFVLNAAAFGMLIGGRRGAPIAAWALVLTYGGSLAAQPIRETVYATKLADQMALATITAVLVDLRRRTLRGRLAAVGIGWAAISTHLFAAIHFAVVFLALGIGVLLRDREWSRTARRLTLTVVSVALPSLPFLLFRAAQAYGPQNEIHTEPQGLLYLFDGVRVISLGVLWSWTGTLWLLFPVAWFFLWRFGRGNEAVLFLLTTSVAVALTIFNPIAVALLEPRVGYLLMRFVWLLPVFGLLTWMTVALLDSLQRGGTRRGVTRVALVALALFLLPLFSDNLRAVVAPQAIVASEAEASPLQWEDALKWMQERLPRGSVVLADPATSYSVPMMTRHYVATLVDQHSSPNDPIALERILDARDALDPFGTWSRLRDVVERYSVTHIALNGRFETTPHFDYWGPSHEWFAAGRKRFDAHPSAFVRLFDESAFVVYEVNRAGLDTLRAVVPERPFVRERDATYAAPAWPMGDAMPALQSVSIDPVSGAPGDTVRAVLEWSALQPPKAGSYSTYIRFDRDLPDGFASPEFIGKPARKVLERLRGERYRFRADHLPTGGQYGVDLWRPDEVVRDSFAIRIPTDVAPGTYTVRVKMLREPHYPNYHLRDYFFDDDYYAGPIVGRFAVQRAGESSPDQPAAQREGD